MTQQMAALTQKNKVREHIQLDGLFTQESIEREVEWFYGPLGLHDFYFIGQSPENIAKHIQSIIAAKLVSKASGRPMDIKLEQHSENEAFFAARSNVQGESTTRQCSENCPTEVEQLELQIEKQYLSGSAQEWIGDGVRSGYQFLEPNEAVKTQKSHYRLQCYRSVGVLDPTIVPYHVRMYFLQKPDFVDPNPSTSETSIQKLADKTFLSRAGDNLKRVYQECLTQAVEQMTPVFHTEIWKEKDQVEMARVTIAYKSGSTHGYFSSIADLYRQLGLFSTRKYVEFFSNGYVIYAFYLQQLQNSQKCDISLAKQIEMLVADASLHFVLPRTSLTPMLRNGLLAPKPIAYAYAAWKFVFHFMHRLPDAYTVVATSLRGHDSSAMARLEQLRTTMKVNTYTESQILEHILQSSSIVKLLYNEFESLHAPQTGNNPPSTASTLSALRKSTNSEQALLIFSLFHTFNKNTTKTNFFLKDKSALSFRLDGEFLSETEYSEKPFAIIYVIGSEFRGFHVRFSDIARGGIRMIRSSHAQVYLNNVSSLFDECYSLASTQQRKNKDIPEGGSKGVILLNQAHQDKADIAFQKYIDALLSIMLQKINGEEELLFLGPDEGTAHMMDWASLYAKKRGYSYWKAITTGKSATHGGIPHDVYGMTTHSVRQYIKGIQRKLNLDQKGAKRITKVQTGGPDGDLGSNEIKMSGDECTIAIVDGSGVLYDPEGLDRSELQALAEKREPISSFDSHKLTPNGYQVLVTQNDVRLANGEIIENGVEFRNLYHLRPSLSADFFVPCGGRPSAVNLNNVEEFLYQSDGKSLRFRYIVEGANLFFTQDARLRLEQAGVILFKDASANKGGVTSSSLEVLAALCMSDQEFEENMQVDAMTGKKPAFYEEYVKEVQLRIARNASQEFECLWREHERTKIPFSVLSNHLSERITKLSVEIQDSILWDNVQLRELVLRQGIPALLHEKIGFGNFVARLPEKYTRALFASQIASRFVYSVGLHAREFAFYEFLSEFMQSR
ncbi:unnamed protein product [Albugo candida]|uniref:Glutamate/phenylalanine/leucine/valine/L-tryptophan dehydrogenase C-terminal domain-containing protein n=1 Tax=Albugo candida TaxID=65357 RepID=A0A024GGR7_9STRA|nr:unnamed protein product [Albugo candida]|eukprot:CCI46082.1 unnamed protein product [Albugo candida]